MMNSWPHRCAWQGRRCRQPGKERDVHDPRHWLPTHATLLSPHLSARPDVLEDQHV